MIEFKGVKHLHDYCAEMRKNSKIKAIKDKYNTDVNKFRIANWTQAVREAEKATKMDSTNRKLVYTINYITPTKKNKVIVKNKSVKRKLSDENTPEETTVKTEDEPKAKRLRIDNGSKIKKLKDIPLEVAGFVAYCTETRPSVHAENSTLGTHDLELLLKKKFLELTEDEK